MKPVTRDRIKPRGLKKGDRVAVVAPSGIVDPEMLERGTDALRSQGFEPVYSPTVLSQHLYMAGTDADRAAAFLEAFNDPTIAGVFCARGGAGALRLLPNLNPAVLRRSPKILLGCSDITCLLMYAWRECGLVTFHGPMVAGDFARGQVDESSLQQLNGDFKAPLRMSWEADAISPGSASGILAGGCLSLLVALEGTPWAIETEGTILFLEDTAARPYQIERMLTQLRLAGKLEQVRAIVFGEMKDCSVADGLSYSLRDVIGAAVGDLGVPVVLGFPSGHTTGPNHTLPLGVMAEVDAGSGTLTILENAVEP